MPRLRWSHMRFRNHMLLHWFPVSLKRLQPLYSFQNHTKTASLYKQILIITWKLCCIKRYCNLLAFSRFQIFCLCIACKFLIWIVKISILRSWEVNFYCFFALGISCICNSCIDCNLICCCFCTVNIDRKICISQSVSKRISRFDSICIKVTVSYIDIFCSSSWSLPSADVLLIT